MLVRIIAPWAEITWKSVPTPAPRPVVASSHRPKVRYFVVMLSSIADIADSATDGHLHAQLPIDTNWLSSPAHVEHMPIIESFS
ncbi:unnamed protein product [Didymodactylos carnosus]|uniref:Uncharacterized protein n=1 Tax=Didymodactylos carnosus TaxID=1234261 RepID=A0A814M717_9BILA|nr:unnamed protein product [Didymodactylos carnosus]CAF1531214.1 unnamed protein product [Didymodactylos carnosus]CAF3841524.1 unnamed protein product [Didymodactylos carnosus]CAF4318210.1 unnamed protein product [Didymodactylos carnosus]